MVAAAAAAMSAGISAAQNTSRIGVFCVSSRPPRTGPTIDPDRSPRTVDPGPLARLGRYVATWLPGLDPEPVSVSTCLYTTTPDQHFVLDRRGPVVACSPCSGHGFKFVPAIGEIVADLADGGSQDEVAWRLAP